MSLLERIEAFARERCAAHDAAHDALHLSRVVANARALMNAERALGAAIDAGVVEAACWLHDVVQLPKGSGPAGESARRSARAARDFLTEHGGNPARVDAVARAIESHSFSGGLRPETIEAAIVQDADRLDALGAVGIARLWVTGVSLGGTLYHPSDPAGTDRELNDRAYGLDHIERKLLRLPETMNTRSGRDEARRRAVFVSQYRDEFLRELGRYGGDTSAFQARVPGVAVGSPDDGGTVQTPVAGDQRARLPIMDHRREIATTSLLEQLILDGSIAAEMIEPGMSTSTVPDAARALGVDERQIIKSLLFAAKSGAVVLAVLSGASKVSRQRLRTVSGLRGLELADLAVVLERTGYPAGGTPPVGHVHRLDVVVDIGVMELPVVFGGGGRLDTLLRITPAEIVRVTQAKVADIAG